MMSADAATLAPKGAEGSPAGTATPAARLKKTLLGRKLGMTQVFNEKGEVVPVTVLEAGPCRILQVKTKANNGYDALQLGFGSRKVKSLTRAELGNVIPAAGATGEARKEQLKKALAERKPAPEFVKEIAWDGQGEPKVGEELTAASFEGLVQVDVTGIMKGRGFAGVIKRHHFHRQPATHGASDRERAPGSLGRQHSISQGVPPGKRMGGHMGASRYTSKNLKLVAVKKEQNVLLVNGSVPGPNGGYVIIREVFVKPKKQPLVSKKEKKPAAGAKDKKK